MTRKDARIISQLERVTQAVHLFAKEAYSQANVLLQALNENCLHLRRRIPSTSIFWAEMAAGIDL